MPDRYSRRSVLINSHDGSTAYQLMSGIFRLVCTNGMITGTQYGDYKIRHQGGHYRAGH